MSTVGDRILQRRKELDLTQEELARRMGYKSKSTINKIEMGKNDIPQSKIVRFAEVLGTTPSYLMGWDENVKKTSPEELALTEGEKMLLELFRNIPEERQPEALELLRVALKMQKKL